MVWASCSFAFQRAPWQIWCSLGWYDDTEDTVAKFYYKPTRNSNGYAAIKLNVCYQITKKVLVIVNRLTGVIIIKGENYLNWIEEEFPTFCPPETGEILGNSKKNDEPPKTDLLPKNHELPKIASKFRHENTEKEVAALWQHSGAKKKSVVNLDETLKSEILKSDERWKYFWKLPRKNTMKI